MMIVRKIGAVIPISRQTLLDHGLVEPTDEERREAEASGAEYDRRKDAAITAAPVFVAALAAVTDPVARAVLDLHIPDERGECKGDEFGGWEAERPCWPCETVATVATVLGVTVPPDLDMVDQSAWRVAQRDTSV